MIFPLCSEGILKILCFAALAAMVGCASDRTPQRPTIYLDYDAAQQILHVQVVNETRTDLKVVDLISNREMPGALWVQVQDQQGGILSHSKILTQDGFVSSNVFVSTTSALPAPVSILGPGEKIKKSVALNRILLGTKPSLEIDFKRLEKYCYVFRQQVFLDGDMERSVTKVTSPFCL